MPIFKSSAELRSQSGRVIGTGMVYVHVTRGLHEVQQATGTLSLQTWSPESDEPAAIRLPDGRALAIGVSRDALSECSRNRILRFSLEWPGQ